MNPSWSLSWQLDLRANLSAVSQGASSDQWHGPREACGVFGIYAPGRRVSPSIFYGLFALQHRGQESAGIATSDGETVTVYKDVGLVSQAFSERQLAGLDGHVGIGHVRYSTTGSSSWENAQPIHRQIGATSIALGHNGNLTNTSELAANLGNTSSTSDSDLMLEAIARRVDDNRSDGRGLERAVREAITTFEGAFSLVLMDQGRLVGVRDPHGFRPLCLGRIDDTGWVLSSETAALDIVGATFVRDIEPGEMVVIDAAGVRSCHPYPSVASKMCLFEFVYFARTDSRLFGRTVFSARQEMGRTLAAEYPADADVVVPVPESGIPAAQGYSEASSIPYADGLVKNRYVGRTFIEPSQLLRDQGIRLKLNPIPSTFEGRSVVLVDDSIVRGSTTRQLVRMVRDAGARQIHLRISSPPYRWPCFYGMDTSDQSELLAAQMSVEEIRAFLDVDSLGYLSLDGLVASTGVEQGGFCTACLSGTYPTDVSAAGGRFILEPRHAGGDPAPQLVEIAGSANGRG